MTETKMTPLVERFVLHWGEMGTKWGINRTVAQVHAVLYLSPTPLNAEDLVELLGVARSNISTSLRELQGWGIVTVVHQLGDRRDHFQTSGDVWETFVRQRIGALNDFFDTMDGWYREITALPQAALISFLKLGGKLRKLLGLKG